jgi:hypothetical protein
MTPDEIRALLADSKQMGLTGATLQDMQSQLSTPAKKLATQKKLDRQDLLDQAKMGMQPTLGPLGMALPGMGLLADLAPSAIGAGTELGQAYQQGYLSNQNFDNMALASLGLVGVPLLGKKGEGKLYSRAIADATEQGVNLQEMTPTFMNRWFKKNNIKPAEVKALKANFEAATLDPLAQVPFNKSLNDIGPTGHLEFHGENITPMFRNQPADSYHNVTFPNIVSKLNDQGVSIDAGKLKYQNILMQVPEDKYLVDALEARDHWGGLGDIHARTAMDYSNPNKATGILAEVQSDVAKAVDSSELPKTTFLGDYPNIATKQSLLQMIQEADTYAPGKPLQVVWPSGDLQRKVNHSQSTAYDNIYDKRVTKAMSEALGDDAVIEQMRQAPFTPVHAGPVREYNKSLDHVRQREEAYATQGFVPAVGHKLREYRQDIGAYIDTEDIPKVQDASMAVREAAFELQRTGMGTPSWDQRATLRDQAQQNYVDLTKKLQEKYDQITFNAASYYPNIYDDLSSSKFTKPGVTPAGSLPPMDNEFYAAIGHSAHDTFQGLTGKTKPESEYEGVLYDHIYGMLLDKKLKELLSVKPVVSPIDLFHTTIPTDKVKRLATEGIPLWMLPIGAGLGAMQYNKEDPYARTTQP